MSLTPQTPDEKFNRWMERLDAAFENRFGLSIHDLADQPYRDWFDSGYTISEAMREIMEEEGLDFE